MAENQSTSCGFSDYNFDQQVKLRQPIINACLLAGFALRYAEYMSCMCFEMTISCSFKQIKNQSYFHSSICAT